ncbi:hypothetical protein P3513_24850, partial [Vibrio parahaemolyticus]|nr:hypothetical protein [Vibrio parahaemolyticus]
NINVVFEPLGDIVNLLWSGPKVSNAGEYFRAIGLNSISGRIAVNRSDVNNVLSVGTGLEHLVGTASEFIEVYLQDMGLTTNVFTSKCWLDRASGVMNSDVTASGSVIVRVDGVDSILYAGEPLVGSGDIGIGKASYVSLKAVDTVGDLVGSGGHLRLYGFFI